MQRAFSYLTTAAFSLMTVTLVAGIVVLATNDHSIPRAAGNGAGLALTMILKG